MAAMLAFLESVGEAIAAQGVRNLAGLAPLEDRVYDLAAEVIRRYRKEKSEAQMTLDAIAMLKAAAEDAKASARELAEKYCENEPDDLRKLFEAYLSQMPAAARQGLKRPTDPAGTSLPEDFDLLDPVQMASLLPRRTPRFRADDSVPHAPQWKFVELLGAGGFGEVWLARHTFLDQRRAFKFCLDPVSRDRLLRHEGEVVKRVMLASAGSRPEDSGIVPLLDAYLDGDAPWLAYEFVEGGDLSAVTRELAKKPPPERAKQSLAILQDLAGVVGHFHRLPQPVVHRDLKPANVLVRPLKDRWLLRVTDFGISHIVADRSYSTANATTPSLTLGATFRGAHTPIYSSPQQKKGMKANVRDDVYALGIMGFQLLMADLTVERPSGRWRKRLEDCNVPPALLDMLELSWDDDPQERPTDARDFAERLAKCLAEKAAPAPAPLPRKEPEKPKTRETTIELQPAPPEPTPEVRPTVGEIEMEYQLLLSNFGRANGPKTWIQERSARVPEWEKAAKSGSLPAFTLLAVCHEHGIGVRQSYIDAMNWYRKAADAGDTTAMNELGAIYYNGRGTATNHVEAMHWFRRAAAGGNAISACWVGWLYQNGHGAFKDSVEAMKWYRVAADAGNALAMYSIAVMYEHGTGVKKDLNQARSWYRRALGAGHTEARAALLALN